jgi:hypothetical protein
VLATLDDATRNRALEAMAAALEPATAQLLQANAEDLREAGESLSPATLARLQLTTAKLAEMAEQVRSVAALPDPLGRVLDAIELDEGLRLTRVSVPLGVVGVIFEARPDAVTQIAALAVKSGNAAILKAGREVEGTASALVQALRSALESCGLPADAVSLLRGRERAQELLAMHDLVDLMIPRGSKALVEYVQANTRIPVLGHAEGVCHIYVDKSVDEALAQQSQDLPVDPATHQLVGERRVVGDRPVAHRRDELGGRRPAAPERPLGGQGHAFVAEGDLGEAPAVVEVTDEVVGREVNLVEEDLVERVQAGHVHEGSDGDALRAHRTDEVADRAVLRTIVCRAREQDPPGGDVGVAGPDLLTRDDPLVAVASRRRGQ